MMFPQQTFDVAAQRPPVFIAARQLGHAQSGGLLDNATLQSATPWTSVLFIMQPPESPRSRLQLFKRQQFDPAHKVERVARSLRALAEPASIKLSVEQWREVVESAEAEDQS
jgi:hypothetical protein